MSEEVKNNEFTFENPAYRQTYWHTCSHVMAQAVKRLWPEVKLAIGPSIDEGWYYDLDAPFAFTPEHLEKIEAEMRKICKEKLKLERFELPREEALKFMEEKAEPYKVELINDLPADAHISFYKQGEFTDLCAGPHLDSTGRIKGNASPLATPPTGGVIPTGRPSSGFTASPSRRRTSWMPTSSGSKRLRSGTTGSWAGSWACSCCGTRAPASPSSCPRA